MNTTTNSSLSFYWKVFKSSVEKFIGESTLTQAAAIAYYMAFSLAPMLLVIFWVAGLWYKELLVREAVFDEFGQLIGKHGANQLMSTLEKLSSTKPSVWTAIIGVGFLLFTASTVFVTIKQALNRIFEVTLKRSVKQGIVWLLLDRFISIAMLCIIAIILSVSMVLNVLITAFSDKIEMWLGDAKIGILLLNHIVLSLISLTLLFAITYRYIPDHNHRLKWKDTWYGAFLTAVLFIAGESLIEIFIGKSQVANLYDAAGGLLVLMLWVYYTSAIFLFGATLIHTRAKLR